DLNHIEEWAGKFPGAVARIAGLLHLARHAGDPGFWGAAVSGETMVAARRIGSYLLEHALAAFAEMGVDPSVEGAKRILAWVGQHGKTRFNQRELFEGLKRHFPHVGGLRPGLAVLVEHNYLRALPRAEHPGPGRKPSLAYEVNPLHLASQNPRNSQNRQG